MERESLMPSDSTLSHAIAGTVARRQIGQAMVMAFSITVWASVALIAGTALFLLANSLAFAELAIDNPKHLDVPEEKARILLRLACRAVATEFHLREPAKTDFDLRLVLGEKDERHGFDEQTGVPTLYLQQWNEVKFTSAAIRFAVQKSVNHNREERMISEILRRSDQISSIPANQLRGADVPQKSDLGQEKQGCLSGIRDASQRDIGCGPVAGVPHR